MDVQTARAVLDRAVAAKNLSNQGQVEAIETLLADGDTYENADLSGIRLAGANLAGGTFSRAMLTGTDLSESTAKEADFSKANLDFANLNGADLTGANLESAWLEFTDAESTVFTDAQASRVSFLGANLRGADFRNADLRDASFIMADLSGARLDGANLENTLFFATLLEDVTFEDATFSNTEITGSALSEGALTSGQAGGTCTTLEDLAEGPRFQVWFTEEYGSAPDDPVESLLQEWYYLKPFPTSGLARCAARSENDDGIYWTFRNELYDTALISKTGRRSDWVSRIVNHMSMMTATLNARHGD